MIQLHSFTFNPFQENTYILHDRTGACIIVDPGCWDQREFNELRAYIEENGLTPKFVLNTHCHIDHIMGNKVVCEHYNIDLHIPRGELELLKRGRQMADAYGLPYDDSPEPKGWLEEGKDIEFGESSMKVISVPGHSPGHIVLLRDKLMVCGDVLFFGSIGRTDLPGGDHDTLIRNIKEKLLILDDDIVVHPGHGPETTIGKEKRSNPFLI